MTDEDDSLAGVLAIATAATAGQGIEDDSAVTALAALAQQARLRVFRLLVGVGPSGTTPGEIAAALDMPASTLSFHLKELAHAGLVEPRRDGRRLIYRADIGGVRRLVDYLLAHCCDGRRC